MAEQPLANIRKARDQGLINPTQASELRQAALGEMHASPTESRVSQEGPVEQALETAARTGSPIEVTRTSAADTECVSVNQRPASAQTASLRARLHEVCGFFNGTLVVSERDLRDRIVLNATTEAGRWKDAAGNVRPENDATLKLAFELGSTKWTLGFTTAPAQRPRVRTGDMLALEKEIALAKARLSLPLDAPVQSCYEAGREGFWLHRWLSARGIENVVVESSSIEVNRRARRAKTDRLDVGKLLCCCCDGTAGNSRSGAWSTCHRQRPKHSGNPHGKSTRCAKIESGCAIESRGSWRPRAFDSH